MRPAPKKEDPASREKSLFLSAKGGLGGSQTGNRNPVRRARDVIEAGVLKERHRGGVASMFSANAKLQPLPGGSPPFAGEPNQLPDTFGIDGDERIGC